MVRTNGAAVTKAVGLPAGHYLVGRYGDRNLATMADPIMTFAT